jgi:hypothetical protein
MTARTISKTSLLPWSEGRWERMRRKTIEVDSDMIDRSQDELSKLIIRLEKNPKISRKDRNTIKKIQEIRDTIQDLVLYAKLKKSVE